MEEKWKWPLVSRISLPLYRDHSRCCQRLNALPSSVNDCCWLADQRCDCHVGHVFKIICTFSIYVKESLCGSIILVQRYAWSFFCPTSICTVTWTKWALRSLILQCHVLKFCSDWPVCLVKVHIYISRQKGKLMLSSVAGKSSRCEAVTCLW